MNRYVTLQKLEPVAEADCPAEIAAGLLLRDCTDDSVLLQLKLQNTAGQSIRSVILDIRGFDYAGSPVAAIPEAVYRDIHALPGTFFGDRKAISLPDTETASVEVSVRAVSFDDGTLWVAPGTSDPAASSRAHTGLKAKLHSGADSLKRKSETAGQHRQKVSRAEKQPMSAFNIVRLCLLGLLIVGMVVLAIFLFSLHQSGSSSDTSDSGVQGVSLSDISAARYNNLITGYWATEVVSLNGTSYTDSTTCSVFSAHLISGGTGFMEMNGVKYELRWGYYSTQDDMIYYSATMSGEKCVMGYSTDRDSPYYHHLIITLDEDTSLVMFKS